MIVQLQVQQMHLLLLFEVLCCAQLKLLGGETSQKAVCTAWLYPGKKLE